MHFVGSGFKNVANCTPMGTKLMPTSHALVAISRQTPIGFHSDYVEIRRRARSARVICWCGTGGASKHFLADMVRFWRVLGPREGFSVTVPPRDSFDMEILLSEPRRDSFLVYILHSRTRVKVFPSQGGGC